jgi:small subunit ribosomal protein S21
MSKHPKKVSVKVKNGNFKKALAIFKRKVRQSEHLFELKQRQYFTKPTTKKRKQKQEAIRAEQRRVKWLKENE